uniref:Zygote arrest 1 truncated variant 6 n=1 Tax=Bos taurus TaxID=9913 RepID=Q1PSA2_BOVIN|nr:zygote arrest 1 truncated variant 6 [Bos taurus]ABC41755.1 zygote arrest 1 truncated variant 6 [Bos taurus]
MAALGDVVLDGYLYPACALYSYRSRRLSEGRHLRGPEAPRRETGRRGRFPCSCSLRRTRPRPQYRQAASSPRPLPGSRTPLARDRRPGAPSRARSACASSS